jgi:hypothetical protein
MIRRREFIAGLGGSVVWPIVARAQQRALPVIGYLRSIASSLLAGTNKINLLGTNFGVMPTARPAQDNIKDNKWTASPRPQGSPLMRSGGLPRPGPRQAQVSGRSRGICVAGFTGTGTGAVHAAGAEACRHRRDWNRLARYLRRTIRRREYRHCGWPWKSSAWQS